MCYCMWIFGRPHPNFPKTVLFICKGQAWFSQPVNFLGHSLSGQLLNRNTVAVKIKFPLFTQYMYVRCTFKNLSVLTRTISQFTMPLHVTSTFCRKLLENSTKRQSQSSRVSQLDWLLTSYVTCMPMSRGGWTCVIIHVTFLNLFLTFPQILNNCKN